MLGALPIDSDKTKWIKKINESRENYEGLRRKVNNHILNLYILYIILFPNTTFNIVLQHFKLN
jgi:hypothetical protein